MASSERDNKNRSEFNSFRSNDNIATKLILQTVTFETKTKKSTTTETRKTADIAMNRHDYYYR